MVAAIKAFQKDLGAKQTGVLNPQERGQLADAARKLQGNVGWKLVGDPVTGARLGIPPKLVPQQSVRRQRQRNGRRRPAPSRSCWRGARKPASPPPSSPIRRRRSPGRKVSYSAVKPDFFVLSGTQGLKKFYIRGAFKDAEVRILTILYDQATEGTMEPVVIAMSSAFNPFPAGALAGSAAAQEGRVLDRRDRQRRRRDPRRPRGGRCLPVDRGRRSRQCRSRRRRQGARSGAAADLWRARLEAAWRWARAQIGVGRRASSLDLTGIADPQNQGGGAAVSVSQGQRHAGRHQWRPRAVAAARPRLLRRPGARRRRQVRRRHFAAPAAGRRSGERRRRHASHAGRRRHRAQIPDEQRRQAGDRARPPTPRPASCA